MNSQVVRVEFGEHDHFEAADDPLFGELELLLDFDYLLGVQMKLVKVFMVDELHGLLLVFEDLVQ